jgi:hypothetical protein
VPSAVNEIAFRWKPGWKTICTAIVPDAISQPRDTYETNYPFLGFLATTLLCIAWLLYPNTVVYALCISIFGLLVVGTGVYGILAAYRYL